MKLKGVLIGVLVIFMLMLAGCGGDKTVAPAEIDESTAKCDVCNMAVVDDQFATQIVLETGRSLVFDDIGCMYNWLQENEQEQVKAEFVRDYQTNAWIETKDASYVYDQQIKTPMAYNVISFKSKDDAEAFVAENQGTVLTFEDLQAHKWEMNMEMKQHMKQEHMHNQGMDNEQMHEQEMDQEHMQEQDRQQEHMPEGNSPAN